MMHTEICDLVKNSALVTALRFQKIKSTIEPCEISRLRYQKQISSIFELKGLLYSEDGSSRLH
jgi:hypothetical protein